jgi:hypothetical protein
MKPAPSALPLLLVVLCLAPIPRTARGEAGGTIDTRERGVVCDAAEQLCYDRSGLSLEATRRNFGRFGEDKARALISRGERGRTFQLSSGIACDVNARTCWDDGWKRKNVAQAMTRHLFGPGSGSGSPGWNNASGSGGSGYSGDCLLRRGGRTLFQGSCELLEQGNGRERRFIATMRNGPRYTFQKQGGTISISDSSGGLWPVQYRDYGRAAVFRWSDMSLEARQGSYGGYAGDRNRALEDLLRQLFN